MFQDKEDNEQLAVKYQLLQQKVNLLRKDFT